MKHEFHYHICRSCPNIWGHSQAEFEDFDDAHTCPQCHTTRCTYKWGTHGEASEACQRPPSEREKYVAILDRLEQTFRDFEGDLFN